MESLQFVVLRFMPRFGLTGLESARHVLGKEGVIRLHLDRLEALLNEDYIKKRPHADSHEIPD